jgi:peptidoglycan/xylan/chitin deacetylase (PgdA/CDA1 family)
MAVAACLLLLWMTVWASARIGSGIYVKALCRADTPDRTVALTFDDGPHPDYTPKILDILARHGVQAAFFVIGSKAEAHPEIVRRMVEEGHIVGNHTYSHSWHFPLLGTGKMADELRRSDDAIEQATGTRPSLFRPPFGVTNPAIARAVNKGYIVAGWDVRSLDTASKRPRTKVFERVRRRLRPGSVVLLHDDREGGDELLEMILAHLETNDYKVERVDKLFGL